MLFTGARRSWSDNAYQRHPRPLNLTELVEDTREEDPSKGNGACQTDQQRFPSESDQTGLDRAFRRRLLTLSLTILVEDTRKEDPNPATWREGPSEPDQTGRSNDVTHRSLTNWSRPRLPAPNPNLEPDQTSRGHKARKAGSPPGWRAILPDPDQTSQDNAFQR